MKPKKTSSYPISMAMEATKAKPKRSGFIQRSITGSLFVLVLVGGILFHSFSFFLLFLFVCVFGLWEFYSQLSKKGYAPQIYIGTLLGALIYTCSYLLTKGHTSIHHLIYILSTFWVIFLVELFRNKNKAFENIALTITGIIYIAVPLSLLPHLVHFSHLVPVFRPKLLLFIFILIWTNDTGAYISGMTIGKHLFFPRISPKKTWEGIVGGVIFVIIISFILSNFFTDLTQINWIIIGILIVIFGTLGDLVESLFKRSINVKDSGNILPGHGGILDRFDSLLFCSPAIFIYLKTINFI